MADKQNTHYISAKESRDIARSNRREIRRLQKLRKTYRRADCVTQMKDPRNVVEFDDLHTYFFTDNGVVKAVNGVSFDIPQGATVGVVGESGCGKSVTSLSLMQLVQAPMGQVVSGSIRFRSTVREPAGAEPALRPRLGKDGKPVLNAEGQPVMEPELDKNGHPVMKRAFRTHEEVLDLAKLPVADMASIRGREIAMIFQEPMTSLNPVFTIGNQLDEVTLRHVDGATRETARKKSLEMLSLVGIAMPDHVYASYPHQLSGGMRQRVMIAMALACRPKILIAVEPTTALDVTIQAQILRLMNDLQRENGTSIIFITHDLGVINEMADDVVVMYCGQVVEQSSARVIFTDCAMSHPYTEGLMNSIPRIDNITHKLEPIPGVVPHPLALPKGCKFAPRCKYATRKCLEEEPPLVEVVPGQKIRCFYPEKEVRNSAEHKKALIDHES